MKQYFKRLLSLIQRFFIGMPIDIFYSDDVRNAFLEIGKLTLYFIGLILFPIVIPIMAITHSKECDESIKLKEKG